MDLDSEETEMSSATRASSRAAGSRTTRKASRVDPRGRGLCICVIKSVDAMLNYEKREKRVERRMKIKNKCRPTLSVLVAGAGSVAKTETFTRYTRIDGVSKCDFDTLRFFYKDPLN